MDIALRGEKLIHILLLEFSHNRNLVSVSICLLVHRCSSKVGKHFAEPGKQGISIADGCNNVGTILHEMMHAVGKDTIMLIINCFTHNIYLY